VSRALLALTLIAVARIARADDVTVTFPLTVDYPTVAAAMRDALGIAPGAPASLWGDDRCRSLVVRDVDAARADGRVRIDARGTARLGFSFLGFCFAPVGWDGWLETRATPTLADGWRLRFRDLDASLLDAARRRSAVGTRLVGLVQGSVEERYGQVGIDLAPPVSEATALLAASVPPGAAEPVRTALRTLSPRGVRVEDDGIKVDVAVTLPAAVPAPAVPETPLDAVELQRWQAALESWDAFLVFVVKDLGLADAAPDVREDLFELLLSARHDLVAALAETPARGVDPVRDLFLRSWDRLRAIVTRAARARKLDAHALRWTTFLAAGDALAAVDAAGPSLGLEISADGLRRLARVLEPEATGDPLAYSDAPDPALRELFHFRDPPDAGAAAEAPAGDDAGPRTAPPAAGTASPAGTAAPPPGTPPASEPPAPPAPDAPSPPAPPTPAPPEPPASTTEPPPAPGAWDWLALASAWAEPSPPPDVAALARRLDRWVPDGDQLGEYRDAVGRLLAVVAGRERDATGVPADLASLYPDLVRTVAWQESCWRQFVRTGGKVTFLVSRTGDVGLMQVNRRVWRGFFDLRKLEWDIVYNAGAGAEILAQLLARFGPREAGAPSGNAARATYAAYNGGPGAYQRYRSGKVPRRLRAIDRAFWEKYQAMTAGQALDFVLCVAEWGQPPDARLSTVAPGSTSKRCMRSRSVRATSAISARHASIASRPRASFV